MFGHRSTIVAQAASMFSAFQHDRHIGGFMPECSNSSNSPRAEREVLTHWKELGVNLSFRSVLLIRSDSTARACRASITTTGKPSARNAS
jgi:hypothetical protein